MEDLETASLVLPDIGQVNKDNITPKLPPSVEEDFDGEMSKIQAEIAVERMEFEREQFSINAVQLLRISLLTPNKFGTPLLIITRLLRSPYSEVIKQPPS